jgi:hypothetical protein
MHTSIRTVVDHLRIVIDQLWAIIGWACPAVDRPILVVKEKKKKTDPAFGGLTPSESKEQEQESLHIRDSSICLHQPIYTDHLILHYYE